MAAPLGEGSENSQLLQKLLYEKYTGTENPTRRTVHFWNIWRACKVAFGCVRQSIAGLQCHAVKSKSRNRLINEFEKLGCERWLIFKQPHQDLDLWGDSGRYLEKCSTQIYRAFWWRRHVGAHQHEHQHGGYLQLRGRVSWPSPSSSILQHLKVLHLRVRVCFVAFEFRHLLVASCRIWRSIKGFKRSFLSSCIHNLCIQYTSNKQGIFPRSLCVRACLCVWMEIVSRFFILCNLIATFFPLAGHLARLALAVPKWLCSVFYCSFLWLHVFIFYWKILQGTK